MKKLFPILAVFALAASGCLREGTDGCPVCLSLTFAYNGTAQGFDDYIGNDVELQIYYDGVWNSTLTIPYERIAGGREYCFRRSISQQIGLIAYAVPAGGASGLIPAADGSVSFVSQGVVMPSAARALPVCLPAGGDLYSGVLEIGGQSGDGGSLVMMMADVFCRVDVIVENADIFHLRFPDAQPSVGLLGTTCSVTSHDGAPSGEEVETVSPLTENAAANTLATGTMHILPSVDGQKTISVNIYRSEGQLAIPVFDSGELSLAGKDIVIIYRMEGSYVTVTLTVNGWDIRTETIPL